MPTGESEAYEDPTHSAAVHGLTPRRIIVIAFFAITMLMSVFSIGIIVSHQSESKYALAKKINLALGVVFFVHAALGIYVTVDMSNEVFSWVTLLVLVSSCACTLVFQMLMLYQVVHKLSVMHAPFWKPISILAVVIIVAAKGLSFALVFYISSINLNSIEVESNFISAFHTAIGFISKIANLVGNLVFDLYKVYAVAWYTFFIQRNIISQLKVDTIGDHGSGKSVVKRLNILMTLCMILCIITLVVAILGFEILHHAVAVSLESTAGVMILALNVWLDMHFQLAGKFHSKYDSKGDSGKISPRTSRTFAKTAPYEDAPLLKGDSPATMESVRRAGSIATPGPMKRNSSIVVAEEEM
ncbi:hypothetical protein HDU77_001582 [Chytriomyces hyalinus]|nr:hypothetical protein HDU77_001582 [Chytriomyces hyalinus]